MESTGPVLPRKIIIKEEYHNPGRITDFSAIIKDLKGAELVIPTTFPIILPVCPVQKTDGLWRMTGDYHNVN